MGRNDGGCDWICDSCGAYMNDQPGFSVSFGTWTCTQCGAINDVSPNNELDLLGMFSNGITSFITRPMDDSDD